MRIKTSSVIKFLLKAVIYLGLIAVVYFYQIIDIQKKYAEKLTNIANSDDIMENGIKPPFMTSCVGPQAKQEVLDKYNMDKMALNEPNPTQKKEMRKKNCILNGNKVYHASPFYIMKQEELTYLQCGPSMTS